MKMISMMYFSEIRIKTKPKEFYVITDKVREIVEESEVENGFCIIFLPSTTSFILLQENCDLLKEDFRKLFEKVASEKEIYEHPDNAHSHLLAGIFGGERIIPVRNASLELGTWQEILLYEADVKPRERIIKIIVVESEEFD